MSEDQSLVPARAIGNIYCGTCSWTDRTLIESGGFYAAGIRSPEARLRYYAQVFPIVEVDSTYYALPSEQNARLWAERTPPGFLFNIKAFGLLTQHPIDPRRLPDVIRERLPSDVLEKGRLYHAGLPTEIRELVWTMHIEAARRGRQARLSAVSVSALVPEEPRQRRLLARASRAAALAGRRRVPRRRLDGSGAAEPHAEAA
jgi:uncharacterized protein DUF72